MSRTPSSKYDIGDTVYIINPIVVSGAYVKGEIIKKYFYKELEAFGKIHKNVWRYTIEEESNGKIHIQVFEKNLKIDVYNNRIVSIDKLLK